MAIGKATRDGFPLLARLAAIACLSLASCGEKTSSTPDLPAPTLSPDEPVLNALEPYDPIYKLNFSGRVVSLKLEGRRIPASALHEVGKLTELNDLSLYGAYLTDESLELLQGLKHLQALGLGATPITEKGLVHLEPLTALRHIWLQNALVQPVPAPGLTHLKEAIPELTVHPQ